jgi:phosphoribosylamine---glycine ligase
MNKKLLIIGSGSREHSLAWKLSQSPRIEKIFIAPGNPGTAKFGENVNIPATDIFGLAEFAEKNQIDLTVVGPEDPLALGVVDVFQSKGLKIWGPSKAAAQIEASKVFSKKLMQEAGVPTAEFKNFTDYNPAWEYVKSKGVPIVIKASGLALGKGVIIAQTLEEAEDTLRKIMIEKIFGDSGSEVVIEEFLEGIEFSAHAFSDGKTFKMFPCSQDHKRIFEGNKGPNTGGIGTITPLPWVTEENMKEISETVVAPILKTLQSKGTPFVGLLYPGLMMTKTGPKVIEFNCRFGGPECESYMRILKSDLLDILEATMEGRLEEINIEWHNNFACCVILCSQGYPDKYEKGKEITGIEQAEKMEDVLVFHAGTVIRERMTVTNGGRVLGVTATGETLQEALDKAYAAVKFINFEGMHYRKDIGSGSLNLTPKS